MVAFLPIDVIDHGFVATASHDGLESAPKQFGGGLTHPHYFGLGKESFDVGDLVVYERARGP